MILSRLLLLLLAALCFAPPSPAARLSDRSPVRLGLWYDPARSGSGFELFAAGSDQVLVWYTYAGNGRPVWYTAAGRFDAAGVFDAALQKHALRDGARSSSDVGRVVLTRQHRERIDLQFSLAGQEGRWTLLPFPVSGIVPEIDHSGAWADPARGGYGLSLTEQGEALIAALYFYDAAGEPTWRAGDNGGHGDFMAIKGYTGACPSCPYAPPSPLDSGTLRIVRHGETSIDAEYSGAPGAAWPLDGPMHQISTPASLRPADRQLASFDDEARLRAWLRDGLLDMPLPPAVIDFSPPPEGESFSATNTQESGVDEADVIESDGRYIYALAPRTDAPGRSLRIAESQDGQTLQTHASRYPASLAGEVPAAGMYLHEDTLAIVAGSAPTSYDGGAIWEDYWPWTGGTTKLEILDRSDPRAPVSRALLEFDAHLVSSRRIGTRLYLVLRKSVELEGLRYPTDTAVNLSHNRALIEATPTSELLPSVSIDGGPKQPAVAPGKVYLPVDGARDASAEFITVVGLDLAAPEDYEAIAIAGAVDAVYVSPERMYVATTRSPYAWDATRGSFITQGIAVTDVHRIELGADGPQVGATGSVEGFLDRDIDRGVFRFSEKDDRLRLVTVGEWGALGRNRLTVLEASTVSPGLLKTLSHLPNRERPAPIGKPGEQLYGTRFVGDKLYAVTFLRIDPLYIVDLTDPADPKIDAALELPGYSDYLHPVGEDLLLGIGHDAVEMAGWAGPMALFQGMQFNLFDVSDPAHPRVIDQKLIGERGTHSALFRSHHALSVLPTDTGTRFSLPMRVHQDLPGDPPRTSTDYARWAWSGLQRIEVQGHTPQDARLVIGQSLATHARGGVEPGYDDSVMEARAVQFAGGGTVYVERGRFWLSNAQGGLLAGPL